MSIIIRYRIKPWDAYRLDILAAPDGEWVKHDDHEAEVKRLWARKQFLTRFLHAIYTARNITIDQDRLNEAMVLLDAWGRAHSQGNGEEDNEQRVRDQESRMRQWLYAPPPTRESAS